MCGIAAVLFSGGEGPVGSYLITMLEALQHRGEDSTGVALYGGRNGGELTLRVLTEDVVGALARVSSAIASVGGDIRSVELNTSVREGYGYDRYRVAYSGSLRKLVEAINATGLARLVSVGRSVEVIKHTLPVRDFNEAFGIAGFVGSHGLGHVRFSTESAVDLFHAHPFQDVDEPDVVVVHNGQITNYWKMRALLEMKGVKFLTENDSELIVHYVVSKMRSGMSLREALKQSVRDLDGPFAYAVATPSEVGVARDRLGLRPLVLGYSDGVVLAASEEGAIQAVEATTGRTFRKRYLGHGEVVVWSLRR